MCHSRVSALRGTRSGDEKRAAAASSCASACSSETPPNAATRGERRGAERTRKGGAGEPFAYAQYEPAATCMKMVARESVKSIISQEAARTLAASVGRRERASSRGPSAAADPSSTMFLPKTPPSITPAGSSRTSGSGPHPATKRNQPTPSMM